MEIKILWSSLCASCDFLKEQVEIIVKELWINTKITKIESMQEITKYNVFSVPALVINNDVIFTEKIPSKEEIKKTIKLYYENIN